MEARKLMNTNTKSLTHARYHAVQLLDSLAEAFNLSARQLRPALDATWELYLEAVDHADTGADGLAHFVRGFKGVLGNLDQHPAPTAEPIALAA
jgi:hypothetical protein